MANINRTLTSPNPPSPEPGTILFTTPRLILRRPLLTDAPALARVGNDYKVWQFMTDRFPHPYQLSDAESFLSYGYRNPSQPDLIAAIFLKTSDGGEGDFLGTMGMRIGDDINYRMWELGYFLGSEYWGKGYASEAVGALVRWCFEVWPRLLRIQASTYEYNQASGKVLVKTGFQWEGLRRESAEKEGKVAGEVFYSILRSDVEKEKKGETG